MPFVDRKTKFAVFSLNHEMYYTYQNSGEELICSFLKAYSIVLNRLNKGFLCRESIEIQANYSVIMSK